MFRNFHKHKRKEKTAVIKYNNWKKWLAMLLKKRRISAHLNEATFCGYGKEQNITEVFKIGNATFVKSNICSGCIIGNTILDYQRNHKLDLNKIRTTCYLLNFPILINQEVKKGIHVINSHSMPVA